MQVCWGGAAEHNSRHDVWKSRLRRENITSSLLKNLVFPAFGGEFQVLAAL